MGVKVTNSGGIVADFSGLVGSLPKISLPNVAINFDGAKSEVAQATSIHAAYIADGIEGARKAYKAMQAGGVQGAISNLIGQATEATLATVEQNGPTKIAVDQIISTVLKR